MNVLRRPADPARPADTQIILLPGAYNRPDDFIQAGFAAPAKARGVDLLLPELDLTQLSNGTAPALVYEQLIAPARRAGVRTIWLGGVSLGGFNSLCLAERYPASIDGLCLLAPWPGSRITRRLIESAGGLAGWVPTARELAADAELRVWYWLRHGRPAASRRPIYLGWGRDDRFAGGIAAYADAMPDAVSEIIDGGHEWPVWARLWASFCERMPG